jgi:hypothetical protein
MAEAPRDWVPVERRWLGPDRSTIRPALIVLGLAVLMALVIPAVDHAIPGGTRVRAGDEIELRGGIRFTPAAGWVLTDGFLAGAEPRTGDADSATVADGAVSVRVRTAPYDGTPAALLEQIKRTTDALNGNQGLHLTGDTQAVRTASGQRGVIARYRGTSADGAIAAFVIDGTGVEVVVTGPPEVPDNPSQAIAQMIASITS